MEFFSLKRREDNTDPLRNTTVSVLETCSIGPSVHGITSTTVTNWDIDHAHYLRVIGTFSKEIFSFLSLIVGKLTLSVGCD